MRLLPPKSPDDDTFVLEFGEPERRVKRDTSLAELSISNGKTWTFGDCIKYNNENPSECEMGKKGKVEIKGELAMKFALDFGLDFSFLDIEAIKMVPSVEFTESLEAEYSFATKESALEKKFEVGTLKFGTITVMAGPVPVLIEFEAPIDFILQGYAEGKAGVKTGLSQKAEFGIKWHEDRGVEWVKGFKNSWDKIDCSASASMGAKAFFRITPRARLYKVIGPAAPIDAGLNFTVGLEGGAKWDNKKQADFDFLLKLFFYAKADAKLDVIELDSKIVKTIKEKLDKYTTIKIIDELQIPLYEQRFNLANLGAKPPFLEVSGDPVASISAKSDEKENFPDILATYTLKNTGDNKLEWKIKISDGPLSKDIIKADFPYGELPEVKFQVTSDTLSELEKDGTPRTVLTLLNSLTGEASLNRGDFVDSLKEALGDDSTNEYRDTILRYCQTDESSIEVNIVWEDNAFKQDLSIGTVSGKIQFINDTRKDYPDSQSGATAREIEVEITPALIAPQLNSVEYSGTDVEAMKIMWQYNSDFETIRYVKGFNIYRGISENGECSEDAYSEDNPNGWRKIHTHNVFFSNLLTLGFHYVILNPEDMMMEYGKTYCWAVSAFPADGFDGPVSNIISKQYGESVEIPDAPSNIQATPGNSQITLSWDAVEGATSYHILGSASSGGVISITEGVTSPYTIAGLENGVEYTLTVVAVNDAGEESEPSAEVKVTPQATAGVLTAPTNVKAVPGDGHVMVSWNAVSGADHYILYWNVAGNVLPSNSTPRDVIGTSYDHGPNITNGITFYYRIVAVSLSGEVSELSEEVSATPSESTATTGTFRIPDTGQTKCYDEYGNERDCAGTGEDGEFSINPMSYTKLADGTVKDNVTGLIWEVKENADGTKDYNNPGDADNTYTWYDPTASNPGTQGDGTDTQDFLEALRTRTGYSDWRLPTREELRSIVDYSIAYSSGEPTINKGYFLNTRRSNYWSSSTNASHTSSAWCVYFYDGNDSSYGKSGSKYVRAVRSGQ